MKKIFTLFASFVCTSASSVMAQHNYIKSFNEVFSSLLPAANGNLLFTNGLLFNNGPQQGVFCSDSSGNLLWSNTYSVDRMICEMVETSGHDFIVAAGWNNPATGKICPGIFKLDANGNFLWAKYFVCDTTDFYIQKIVRTTDNYNVLVATQPVLGYMKAIIKFDDNGNIIWAKDGSALPAGFNFVAPVESGGLLLLNIGYFTGADIVKLDSSGTVAWASSYIFGSSNTEMAGDVQVLPNGNYAVAYTPFPNADSTELTLLFLNPNGIAISSRAFKFWGDQYVTSLNMGINASGNLLMQFNIAPGQVAVMKTDAAGSPFWMDKLDATGSWSGDAELFSTFECGLAINSSSLGNIIVRANTRPSDLFSCFYPSDTVLAQPEVVTQITYPESVATLPCVSINHNPAIIQVQVSSSNQCSSVSVGEEKPGQAFAIFPNPANNFLSISNLEGTIKFISVFNLLGENVLVVQLQTRNFKPETELDVSSLPTGIYFIQATTDEGIQTQKFIKD